MGLLPPPLRRRPFTVAEALALGVTRGQLRGPAVRRPFTGVRVPVALPDDLLTRCRAARLVLPGSATFTGRTAVALLGLPWCLGAGDVLAEPLHVALPLGAERPELRGVAPVRSAWALRRWWVRDDVPVVHPVHLWASLAALPLDDQLAVADQVRRRWAGTAEMGAAVAERAGSSGVVRAREVLALVRHPVDSPMETRLRRLLVRGGLPEPEVGWPVHVQGRLVAVVDLAWPALRVAVEHEGDHHRSDRRQWQRDMRTRDAVRAAGWEVLQLTADDVLRRPEEVVARASAALERAAARHAAG